MITILSTQKLLTPRGTFKVAKNLANGDVLLNNEGKRVSVKNVKHLKPWLDGDSYVCYKSKWWSENILIPGTQVISTTQGLKYAAEVVPSTDAHLFPSHIDWDLPKDIRICYNEQKDASAQTYSLGYVLGAFLVIGIFNDSNITVKYKIPNDDGKLLLKIASHMRSAFPKAPPPNYDFSYGCLTIDPSLHHVFAEFDKDVSFRRFPDIFISKNADYIIGVYDAIIELAHMSGNMSQHVYELALVALIIMSHPKCTYISIPFAEKLKAATILTQNTSVATFELVESKSCLVDSMVWWV